ncbi:MAG: hypothetical protein RL701_1370 [Pseudomonadota bacterium]|jgi:hypothetical protein
MGGTPELPKGGSHGSAGNAGIPGLDPNIAFVWKETVPGAGGCRAAKFTGTFTCRVETLLSNEPLEGSLLLVLNGSTESQVLAIGSGQLMAFDFDPAMRLVLQASVSGGLDCGRKALTADVQPTQAELMPIERQLAWLLTSSQPTASGTLRGTFDPDEQVIQGDLSLVFDPTPRCNGTFVVRASP